MSLQPTWRRGPQAPLWLLLCLHEAAIAAAARINRHGHAGRWHNHTVPPRFLPVVPQAACGELLAKHPDGVRCPAECPYLRIEPDHLCQFTCVPAKECSVANPLANFADPTTMQCEVCLVTACQECIDGPTTCKECQAGFLLEDGVCVSKDRHWWHGVYAFLAVIVALLVMYIVSLAYRPNVNPVILEGGLIFRKFSKTLEKMAHKNQPYSLWLNLRRHDVAGVGVLLFFDWQFWILVWSCVIMAVFLALGIAFPTRPSAIEYQPGDPRSFQACNFDVERQASRVADMKLAYFWAVFVLYVLSTTGSLALARFHKRMFKNVCEEELTMSDFTLMVQGLPRDPKFLGSERLEEDLKDAFEKALGSRIIGVSVCWDYRDHVDEVQVEVRAQLDRLQKEKAFTMNRMKSLPEQAEDLNQKPEMEEEVRTCCDTPLQCFDGALGYGGPCNRLSRQHEEEVEKEVSINGGRPEDRVLGLLRTLPCSGHAFVVFETPRECDAALARLGGKPITIGGRQVTLQRVKAEADEVLWESFGATHLHTGVRLIIGVIVLITTIAVLDLFFYSPYVHYLRSSQTVNRRSEGGAQEFLLGSLVIVANQIIYKVCEKVAQSCNFHFKSTSMVFYVVFYTVAVLVNTIVDLHTVILITAGYTYKDLLDGSTDRSVLSAEVVLQNPALQRTLFEQTSTYIYSCLILPFLCEPFVLAVLPYYLNVWLVRSRRDVTLQDAEDNLACPQFELSRYGDILINVMLCAVVLPFTYRDLWQLFLGLVVSQVIIYAWDHYRLLRVSTSSHFKSSIMDQCALYLTALPCAVMAACLVCRIFGSRDELKFAQEHWGIKIPGHNWFWTSAAIGMLVHLCFHLLALKCIQGGSRDEDNSLNGQPYSVVAEEIPCSFFNTNPVHCLRSKFIYEHTPHCIPFVAGKDYLLEPNHDIGCYYEGELGAHPSWTWATGSKSLTNAGAFKEVIVNELKSLRSRLATRHSSTDSRNITGSAGVSSTR